MQCLRRVHYIVCVSVFLSLVVVAFRFDHASHAPLREGQWGGDSVRLEQSFVSRLGVFSVTLWCIASGCMVTFTRAGTSPRKRGLGTIKLVEDRICWMKI